MIISHSGQNSAGAPLAEWLRQDKQPVRGRRRNATLMIIFGFRNACVHSKQLV
jgi:hypothetical protein